MKRTSVLAVLLALLIAAPARADHLTHASIPADAQVTAEVRVALELWRARGVTGCPDGVGAYFVDDLPSSDGDGVSTGQGVDCDIWLNGTIADRTVYRNQTFASQVSDARDECSLVAHEVGHALGLDHAPTGMMAAADPRTMPRECKTWAPWWVAPVRRWWRPGWGFRR